jgi:hypothetical protein
VLPAACGDAPHAQVQGREWVENLSGWAHSNSGRFRRNQPAVFLRAHCPLRC